MESLIECYLPPQLNSILRLKKKEWWRDRKMVFLATWMPYHPPHLHCYHHSILWYRWANRAHWSVRFCNSIRLEIINNKTCTWAFFPLKRELNGLVQTSVDLAACYPCNMPNDRSQSGNWISWVPAPRLLSSLVWFFLSGHIKKVFFSFHLQKSTLFVKQRKTTLDLMCSFKLRNWRSKQFLTKPLSSQCSSVLFGRHWYGQWRVARCADTDYYFGSEQHHLSAFCAIFRSGL